MHNFKGLPEKAASANTEDSATSVLSAYCNLNEGLLEDSSSLMCVCSFNWAFSNIPEKDPTLSSVILYKQSQWTIVTICHSFIIKKSYSYPKIAFWKSWREEA